MPSSTGRPSDPSTQARNMLMRLFMESQGGLPTELLQHTQGGPLIFDRSVYHSGSTHNVVYATGGRPVRIDMNSAGISVSSKHRKSRATRTREDDDDGVPLNLDSEVALAEALILGTHDHPDGLLDEGTPGTQTSPSVGSIEDADSNTRASDECPPLDTNETAVTKTPSRALDEGRDHIAPGQGDAPITANKKLTTKCSLNELVEEYEQISISDLKNDSL